MSQVTGKYWTIFLVGMLVVWVRLLLRVLSLPQVLGMLEPQPVPAGHGGPTIDDLVHYIDRWLLLFPYNAKGNCFPRSVALYRYARQSGFPVRLHCGIKKDGGKLDGHAWLTLDDHPFHEFSRQWQSFTVTFSYPTDSAADKNTGMKVT